jgi:hypothetical protein
VCCGTKSHGHVWLGYLKTGVEKTLCNVMVAHFPNFVYFIYLLAVLGFELRALHSLDRCSTAWAMPTALFPNLMKIIQQKIQGQHFPSITISRRHLHKVQHNWHKINAKNKNLNIIWINKWKVSGSQYLLWNK